MFKRSLGHGFDSPAVHNGIEFAYEQSYGTKAAVEHYLALTHREPQNPGVWYALALAYWSLPDPENAVSAIKEALLLSPSTREFRQLLAGAMCSCVLNEQTVNTAVQEVDDALKHDDVEGAEFVRWCLVDGLFAIGDWDRAYSFVQDAYQSAREFGLVKWRAHIHLSLAERYLSLGDTQQALQHADSATKFFTLVNDIDGVLSSRALKIGILRESGALQEGLRYCFKVFSGLSSKSDSRLWGGAFIDAAWTFTEIGAIRIALAMGIEAQRILQQCPYAVYDHIRMNTALGLIHQKLGNLDLAIRYQRLALKMARGAGGPRYSVPTCEGKLAISLLLRGDILEARSALQRQLVMAKQARDLGEEKEALMNLGELEVAKGLYESAKSRLASALEIGRAQADIRAVNRCYMALGRLAEVEGKCEQAKGYFACIVKNFYDRQNGRYIYLLTEQTSEWYLAQQENLVHALCRVGCARGALSLIETARRDVSIALVSRRMKATKRASQGPLTSAVMQGEHFLAVRTAIGVSVEKVEVDWAELLPLLAEFLSIADSLEMSQPELRSHMDRSRDSGMDGAIVNEIREGILTKDDALVEFWVGELLTERFGLSCDTMVHRSIQLGRSAMRRLSNAFVAECSGSTGMARKVGSLSIHSSNEENDLLSDSLLAGLEAVFRDRKNVRIVANEPLEDLPFEALRMPEIYDRTLMVNRFSIGYAPSVFMYKPLAHRSPSILGGILVLAPVSVHAAMQENTDALVSTVLSGGRENNFRAPLPLALKEVESIKALFGLECDVKLGPDANKMVLKKMAHKYQILHIAAHASVRQRPGDAHAILLSSDSSSDGNLNYSEISQLDLPCDLVVLSGCSGGQRSGTGDWGSLAGAFLEAGAASVIAAGWDLEDTAADLFFERFYESLLTGKTVGRSLQLAKISLIENGFNDPRLWGSFRLYGSDDPFTRTIQRNRESSTAQIAVVIVVVMIAIISGSVMGKGRGRKEAARGKI
jgi:tetratricopeptide (TPR) repeat protein